MPRIRCVCPACLRTEKVTELIFIPCSTSKDMQIEIHLKCGHVVVRQLKGVPIGREA